ncbi:MAG: helix-turn-helix domain-containing protein [Cyclobacteriaceae bacterium]
MFYKYSDLQFSSHFTLTDNVEFISSDLSIDKGLIHIVWNRKNTVCNFMIDDIPIMLEPNQITTITYLQKVKFDRSNVGLTVFSFNREFYCINDHDHEVSCNGIIFFGTQDIPIISLDEEELRKFELLLQVFEEEFATKDNIQGEMLKMLLKRLIIKCTRLAKMQLISRNLNQGQIDIIRKFNVLVDTHYKNKRQVADYADLLHKSPKTLANLFSVYGSKTPLRIIHERIVLEGKRLLTFTDQTTKEVAYSLGFDDVSSFNKMFRKIVGDTPTGFRNKYAASIQ